MKKQLLLLCTLILAFVYTSKSQVSHVHLSFGGNGVVYQDTTDFGNLISFSFWIKNTGDIPLNSEIEINLLIGDSTLNNSDIHFLGSFADSDTTLGPGDSLYIFCWDYISAQSYVGGGNIVVIWPSATSPFPLTTDEYTGTVFVNNSTSINNKFTTNNFAIYPNPITEQSVITNLNMNLLSTIRVFDILGNLIYIEEDTKQKFIAIQKEKLKTGIYFVEIISGENKIIKKIIIK